MASELPVEELPNNLSLIFQARRRSIETVEAEEYGDLTVYSTSNHRIVVHHERYTMYTDTSYKEVSHAYSFLKEISKGRKFEEAALTNYGYNNLNSSFGARFGRMFPEEERLPEEYRQEVRDIAEKYFSPDSLEEED